MATEDQKTAFRCPLGFYQFTCMPRGIRHVSVTFQRVMCLNDIIAFGATLFGHEERLMQVLYHLKEEELKLSADK